MTYTWTRERYGPEPHHWLEIGAPATQGASILRCFAYLPGGGWGLRDIKTLRHPIIGAPIFRECYNNPSHGAHETSVCVFVNAASNTYNGLSKFFPYQWASTVRWFDTVDWVSDPTHVSVPYQCILAHAPIAEADDPGNGNDPGVGTDWTTYWVERTRVEAAEAGQGNCLHEVTAVYAIDDTCRGPNGNTYCCISSHTATAADVPESGGNWATYWKILSSNEIISPRIGGFGEMTPAFCASSARDFQRAIQYLRAHSTRLQIFPGKITGAGDSAGGRDVGLANALEDLDFAHGEQTDISHEGTLQGDGRCDAQIVGIAPTGLENYAPTNTGGQATFLSFMKSLFGDDRLAIWDGWDALPAKYKRAQDILANMENVGIQIPTFLAYYDQSLNSFTEAEVYDNVNLHHPWNGQRLFKMLKAPVGLGGGFDQGDAKFLCKTDDLLGYAYYTTYEATGGTEGVHFTRLPLTAAALGGAIADWIELVLP